MQGRAGELFLKTSSLLTALGAIALAGLIFGYSFDYETGLWSALAVAILVLLYNVRCLFWLARWLAASGEADFPETSWSGVWKMVFERIAAGRLAAEKNSKKLKNRETRYRRTLSALPDGVVLMKSDWRIDWCNQAAERQLGVDPELDRGRLAMDVFQGTPLADFIESNAFDKPVTLSLKRESLELEARIVILGRKNLALVTHDVTERVRLDAVRRDFVANVSHELRTPLTVVNGFLELAEESGGSGPVSISRSHIELMQEQSRRMSGLVSDLLALSRLEVEQEPQDEEVIDVQALASDVMSEGCALSSGRQEIVVEVAPEGLKGSYSEIRSALMNLVSNAVRYTPEGGHIRISWAERSGGGEGFALSVTDDGIGIEAKHIPRLTERFYRVDKGRSRDTGGTGLGLAIVKHVMIRHGGSLAVDSTPGQGSTFSMLFPASRVVASGSVSMLPGPAESE